jgi:DNA-binding beta-propeller fold protein YncE
MERRVCLFPVIALFLIFYSTFLLAEEGYIFIDKWPEKILYLKEPNSVALDNSGNVYIIDTDTSQIHGLDYNGIYLSQWGNKGSGNGQFERPKGIAVDSSGNVYVADTNNHRIQKFYSDGTFHIKWGGKGSGDGQFSSPGGIAVDSSGNVYVADTNKHRIQKFDADGNYLTKWGGIGGIDGSGDGQFFYPEGIAVDSSGNVYVADTYNYRIQKFDSNGIYLTKWGGKGSGDGQFNAPKGIAVASSGNVYVADTDNHKIQKFDSNGTYLTKWGDNGSINGQFFSPGGIAVDSSGNVYVADTNNYRIQKFDSNGAYITKYGGDVSGDGQLYTPGDIVSDSLGDILYVADTGNNRIQKFDSNGTYLTQWGAEGSGNGQLEIPEDVALSNLGDIYVADTGNHRVQKFDSDGNYLAKWGGEGTGNSQFKFPEGIAVDSSGNVYVADTQNNRIQKFDSDGNYLKQWSDGQFERPGGIAVDNSGNVYVADTNNHRIQKFDSDGTYRTEWGGQGSGNGQFIYPGGIAVDSSGNVYVADTDNYRIQKFDSNGIYLTKWGGKGSGNGQFIYPGGIAVDSSGNVYVADTGNHRIQLFQKILPTMEWEIHLNEGWNLISFPINKCFYYGTPPIQPNYVNLVNVESMGYNSLAQWFSSVIILNNSVDKHWQMIIGIDGAMDSSLPSTYHSLEYISPLSGYWVKIPEGTGGVILRLYGELFDPSKAIPLVEGWNLAGCTLTKGYYDTASPPYSSVRLPIGTVWESANAPTVAGKVLTSIEGKYSMVISEYGAYDPKLPPDFSSLHYMAPGYGYWIKMDERSDLVYSPGSTEESILAAPGDKIFEELLIPPTRTSMLIYGSVNFDGTSDNTGKRIQVFSQTGVLCGQAEVTQDGNYRIMLVYGDDPETSQVEGAKLGEKLIFYLADRDNSINTTLLKGNYDVGGHLEDEVSWMGDKIIMRVDLTARPNVGNVVSKLLQNYPNPFNPDTWIPYQLKNNTNVNISIHSVTGQLVRTLSLGRKPAGLYTDKERAAYWDGKNEYGEVVASGVYFYSIQTGDFVDTKKMIISK